ncbi:MAG TPA: hypothetical protein VK364_12590 [Hymenobacter sp.]|nr:hypothetical protein [Hymenobacter sp.]
MKPLNKKRGAVDFDGLDLEIYGVIDDVNAKYLREREMLLKAQELLLSRTMLGGFKDINPEDGLLDVDNITGCFIGIKQRQGTSTGKLALVVTVVIKSSAIDKVAERALIPPHVLVDGYSVVTDVIEDGVGRFTVKCGSLMGPLAAGREEGTIGAIVQRNGSAKKYVLSNSHVLSDFGLNAIGTKFYAPPKHPSAGGVHVCTLSHNIPLLKYNSNLPNENVNIVDCALGTATVNAESSFAGGIGVINPSPTALLLNAPVMMCGATSGFRTGLIVGLDMFKLFGFENEPDGQYNFKSLYVISPTDNMGVFAKSGDSGALLLSSSNRPVGLIFGSQQLTYASRIDNVMKKLNIKKFVS